MQVMWADKSLISLFVFLIKLVTCCQARKTVHITIDTQNPVHEVHRLSPSVAMGITIFQYGWINYFNDTKLRRLARGLGTSFLRVGGTKADFVTYEPDDIDYRWKNLSVFKKHFLKSRCRSAPKNMTKFRSFQTLAETEENENERRKLLFGVKKILKPIVLNGEEWRMLNEFCKCVDWRLIFDLNLLNRNGSSWNSTNVETLLEFTQDRYHVDWELGNEPNSYPHKTGITLTPEQVGHGFLKLKMLLNRSGWWNSSLVLGPDANRIDHNASDVFLSRFLNVAGGAISDVTVHQYYLKHQTATKKKFLSPTIMNSIISSINRLKSTLRATSRNRSLWLGETASTSGGGAPGLSNSYIDGFLWLDKLGLNSRLGVSMVIRQTFLGSHYSLIDDNFDPLPDYWLTLLYKRLVGSRVLNLTMQVCSGEACMHRDHGHVRLYAHCANTKKSKYKRGSIVVSFLNLKKRGVRVFFEPFNSIVLKVDLFLLEPDLPGNLTSQRVNLNGRLLQLTPDGFIPSLPPKHLSPTIMKKGIFLPAQTYGFIVLRNVNALACFT